MSKNFNDIVDIVVIGGGPAGMMAAATAAFHGSKVLLLEKNTKLGKKLSITGGGRCNVTNNQPVVREMLSSYKEAGKYLFSTFMQHGVAESIEWFAERGVPFKEENEGRLFPETESAETIRATLQTELEKTNVTVQSGVEVQNIAYDAQEKLFLVTTNAGEVKTSTCIVATGGYARPETGSTGDGFVWLEKLGHTIIPASDALVPVVLKADWIKKLSGITLPKVKVSVWVGGKKQKVDTGRVLFTHFGVTGPLILNMSKLISDYVSHEAVELHFDLYPQFDSGQLKDHIKELLQSNKKLQNVLAEDLPLQFVKGILNELKIDGETPCHSVRKEDRASLLQCLKAVVLPVEGLLGADKAIISSGGVSLDEIDFKTMASRIIPDLYIVGDLLNINRPSGGYSLQLCWSTGFVAGLHAGKSRTQRVD